MGIKYLLSFWFKGVLGGAGHIVLTFVNWV